MQILAALPAAEGEAYNSSKSLHYLLLNEMLQPNQSVAEKWGALDKEDIFIIA